MDEREKKKKTTKKKRKKKYKKKKIKKKKKERYTDYRRIRKIKNLIEVNKYGIIV